MFIIIIFITVNRLLAHWTRFHANGQEYRGKLDQNTVQIKTTKMMSNALVYWNKIMCK
jgi:TnpA family transposase